MKTKILALALATVALGLASTAKADSTRINVSFGINSRPAYAVPAPVYVPAPVVTAPSYGYSDYNSSRPRGHWETVTNKIWVPERWINSRDRWGRPVRVLERGYFTYRTDRVWVENHHGYGYGYRD
jgi:hypothetical protein